MKIFWKSAALSMYICACSLGGINALPAGVPAASPAPAGGIAVLNADWRASIRQDKHPEFGTATDSDSGLLLTTKKIPDNEFKLDVHEMNVIALHKGQPLLLRFAGRSIKASEMTGQTQLSLVFHKASPDWLQSIQTYVQLNDQWKRFDIPFKVSGDYAIGEASLNVWYGFAPQVAEIADVQLIAYPLNTEMNSLPRTQMPIGEPEPKLLADTVTRIVHYRKLLDAWAGHDPAPTPGRTLHVLVTAAPGGDGSVEKPFATIQSGVDAAMPGDSVVVGAGVYDKLQKNEKQNHTLISKTGKPDAWISIRAANGARPKIIAPTWKAFSISGSHYVELKGFEIEGIVSPISDNSGNGVAIVDRSTHIRVIDNIVHGFGGAGIYSSLADYLYFEGNVVYHTSHGSDYGTSGLSLYQCINSDDAPGYHNVIRRNMSYGNENLRPFRNGGGEITDGNGIIMDDNHHTQKHSKEGLYRGWTLIENNLVFGNGGRGIHSFLSDNIDVINNTIYMDQHTKDVKNGEMTAIRSDQVSFFNNVLVTLPDLKADNVDRSKNTVISNNFFFNSEDVLAGRSAILGKDPLLMHPSVDATDPQAFRPRVGSPLLGAGFAEVAPKDDFFGRIRTGAIDLGAIQGASGN